LAGLPVLLALGACGTTPAPAQQTGNTQVSATDVAARPGHPVPAWAVRRLTAMADHIVKADGDHPVQWAAAVVTTHVLAMRAVTPGDSEPADPNPVAFVLVIKGHFVCNTCSIPAGAHAPTGTYAAFDYTGSNFHGESDGSLSNRPPAIPLSELGPVTYLHVHP